MRKDKPSKTARKVALNIVTLGAKPGMDKVLPPGVAEATARLLVASGAVSAAAVRFSRSRTAFPTTRRDAISSSPKCSISPCHNPVHDG